MGVSGFDYPCHVLDRILSCRPVSFNRCSAEGTHLAWCPECHCSHSYPAQYQSGEDSIKVRLSSFSPCKSLRCRLLTLFLIATKLGRFRAMHSSPSPAISPSVGTGFQTLSFQLWVISTSLAGSIQPALWSTSCLAWNPGWGLTLSHLIVCAASPSTVR